MLLRFRVKNFRSIKEEQELSLVASSLKDQAGPIISTNLSEAPRVLRAIGIYGANASGKSNILSAMSFMESAVRSSYIAWQPEGPIPYDPFRLDKSTKDAASEFSVDIVVSGTRYQYGFASDRHRIQREWLHAYPSGRKRTWFTRDANATPEFRFGKSFEGPNAAVRELTRANSLFLSVAAQNNHAAAQEVYRWFILNLWHATKWSRNLGSRAARRMALDPAAKQLMLHFMRAADLGIVGLDAREVETQTHDAATEAAGTPSTESRRTVTKRPDAIVSFRHAAATEADSEAFDLESESDGTRALFTLCADVITALKNGHVLMIDELEASLHPAMALEVLRWFNSPTLNASGAQLVFNTHDVTLLSANVLRRDQVWFVEKDAVGASHLYPLSDFKTRASDNLQSGYLQGRYGAVPFFGELNLPDSWGVPDDTTKQKV